METVFRLRKPLDRAVREGHPWLYRDAVEGSAVAGTVVRVNDRDGTFLARAIADDGPIALRVFTVRDEALDDALLRARIGDAVALRDRVVPPETDAYRLLHGEGDRLPGFVCDVYGPFAVLRCDGAGALAWRARIVAALREPLAERGVHSLLFRSPVRGETDHPKTEVAYGETPADVISVRERGATLVVDLLRGQKTGLFLDQRESRARVRALARGMRVLNLYGYTGGFSIAAGLGGASHVETVDVAARAIALAERTWAANGLPPERHRAVAADALEHLARLAEKRTRFDLVIADPPSFAPREDAVTAALAGYRSLHVAAMARVAPGGTYLAASCSSHVDRDAFMETLRAAAHRARRTLQVLDTWGSPPDHPRLPAFPEGDYLKVVMLRVL